MSPPSGTVATVAAWELRAAARSRWVLAATALYSAAAVALALGGLRSMGSLGITGVGSALDALLSLGVLLPPLVGLLLGAGAVAGAREHGVLAMIAAQPVSRRRVGLGMLAGQTLAVWVAVFIGLGMAAVVLAPAVTFADLRRFGVVGIASLAAGFVGVSLGLAISALSSSRSQATAVAAGVWFMGAIGVDLIIAGLAPGVGLGPAGLLGALVANPLEAIRLATFLAFDEASLGPFGAYLTYRFGSQGGLAVLTTIVLAWSVLPALVLLRTMRLRDV